MSRTPSQMLLDDVLRRSLQPLCKALGYRKDGHTWRRALPSCVQVLNVQSSKHSTRNTAVFTLNLGIFFPAVQAACIAYQPRGPGARGPSESECHLRVRIGQLMSTRRDKWWELGDGAAVERVASEVATVFAARGQPWLDTRVELDAARRDAEALGTPVGPLAFALAAGDVAGAAAWVNAFLRTHPEATAVRDWAEVLALPGTPFGP